jgi:hypothetical protein
MRCPAAAFGAVQERVVVHDCVEHPSLQNP